MYQRQSHPWENTERSFIEPCSLLELFTVTSLTKALLVYLKFRVKSQLVQHNKQTVMQPPTLMLTIVTEGLYKTML